MHLQDKVPLQTSQVSPIPISPGNDTQHLLAPEIIEVKNNSTILQSVVMYMYHLSEQESWSPLVDQRVINIA